MGANGNRLSGVSIGEQIACAMLGERIIAGGSDLETGFQAGRHGTVAAILGRWAFLVGGAGHRDIPYFGSPSLEPAPGRRGL